MQNCFVSLMFIVVYLVIVVPAHAGPPSSTTTGTRVGLVLLAQFPDRPGDVVITPGEIDAFCNDPSYTGFGNATSVYGYFNIQSNGRLKYNNRVTHYFEASQDRSYYTDPAISYGTRAKELINEGLSVLKDKGFDFTTCDADKNGTLDSVSLFYAGENVNAWSEGLWQHKWSSNWSGLSGEGVDTSFQYQISELGTDVSIGRFCHESAHMICGFPDLYSYNGNAADVRNYSLMSSSGTKHPPHVDPYLKLHAGWATITELSSASHLRGVVSVDNNSFYRFRNPSDPREYFILSMRADAGYEGIYGGATSPINPTNGLVIWHAMEQGSNTYSSIFTGDSPAADYSTPYELMVVEAGPSSSTTPWYDDPAPGSNDAFHAGGISEISGNTTPALNFWDRATGRTTASYMTIHSVSNRGNAMSFVAGQGALTGSPRIGLTPTHLTPACDYMTDAPPQTFAVFNSGGGTLSYTISEYASWLSVNVTSGTATTEADVITISYDTNSLAAGTYTGNITITDSSATNNPQTIDISLTVNDPAIISTSVTNLNGSLLAGAITGDFFTIKNSGGGTLRYLLSESSPWLSMDRATGTVAAEEDTIQVTYDASNLVEGIYSAEILVDDARGLDSQTLNVTLNVSGHVIVRNPAGSETLWQGNQHRISWMTDGWVPGDVNIELYKGGIPVSIIATNVPNQGTYLWHIPEDQSIGTDHRIRIASVDEPSVFGESHSDFAIEALPALTGIPYSESFESGFGGWAQSADDDFDWTRDSGGTPSVSTGPSAAQHGSFYIYTEASSPNSPAKSALLEKAFDLRDAVVPMLSFYYHMYGSTTGTLAVRISADKTHWTTVFSKSGDQGDAWQTSFADLSPFAGQVVMVQVSGVTGSNYFSDMALDVITIYESTEILTYDTRLFTEAMSNDGSISNSVTIDLAGDTFTPDVVSAGYVTVTNVPSGLTAQFVYNSNNQITLNLIGNAINHTKKDSVFDLQVHFTDSAFTSGNAAKKTGNAQNLMIDYFETTSPESESAPAKTSSDSGCFIDSVSAKGARQ